MIVSHKYGFIFIKTGKVGGTSFEIAMSRFLGPDDIITPVSVPDEIDRAKRGYRTCQNYEKRVGELGFLDWPQWLKYRALMRLSSGDAAIRSRRRLPKKYWNHMDAAAIRERVGKDVWDSYCKITIERNPWDKVVSRYFWESRRRGEDVGFGEYVRSGEPLRSHFERYSIGGIVVADRIIRYERMSRELTELSQELGLPDDLGREIGRVSAKTGYRSPGTVEDYYDDETREIVEIFFAREIRLMGFAFGDC